MRVLISGATGFVGRKLVSRLVEGGHEVVALSRNVEKARKVLSLPTAIFEWDGRSPVPSDSLRGIQAVVNLAGEGVAEKRWTAEQKRKILESRVLGTRQLVQAVAKMSVAPEVFVSASAIGYYGDTGEKEADETAAAGSDFLADVCKRWEAELDVLTTRKVILRTGVALGVDGGALHKLLPIFETGLGGPLGDGKQWMSWIHVDDLVSMYLWALHSPQVQGVFNAVAPTPVTNAAFTQDLAKVLQRPAFLPVPKFGLRLLMGEASTVVLASQRIACVKAMKQGFPFQFSKLPQALRDLCGEGAVAVLEREQFVGLPVEEIFPFFSDASNLEVLTPPWMGFRILRSSTEKVGEGTLIDYRIKVRGVPMRWRTRIEQWVPNRCFVDTQLKGPYRYWHHTHTFIPVKGGTLMRDRVKYRLPAGSLGRLVAGRWVSKDVEKIFNFRFHKVDELFNRKQ